MEEVTKTEQPSTDGASEEGVGTIGRLEIATPDESGSEEKANTSLLTRPAGSSPAVSRASNESSTPSNSAMTIIDGAVDSTLDLTPSQRPPLPKVATAQASKPRGISGSGGARTPPHHSTSPSTDSLPVLPEEEVVEIQFDVTASASMGERISNVISSNKSGAGRNSGGGATSSSSSSAGSILRRPPIVSRVHSVDGYNLDNDAMIAMSMGGLGGGGDSEDLDDNESAAPSTPSSSSRRRITTAAPGAAAAAVSCRRNNDSSPKVRSSAAAASDPRSLVSSVVTPAPRAAAELLKSGTEGNTDSSGTGSATKATAHRAESVGDSSSSATASEEEQGIGNGEGADDEDVDGDDVDRDDRIRLGICAMDKKARSKPMAEILSRLDESLFHVVFFGDELIKNSPIEEWPVCDGTCGAPSRSWSLKIEPEENSLPNCFNYRRAMANSSHRLL
jgi:hypothetical protein